MQFVLRIFSTIGLLIFFLGVLITSFTPRTQDQIMQIDQPGYASYLASGSYIHQEFSYFEDVYSFSGEVSLVSENDMKVMDVSESRIITSFRGMGEKYMMKGSNFTILQEGPGEVFIDTISVQNKVFIFALNAPITVSLVGDDGSETFTNIFLTPHMYLEFQPVRGKFLKDADRVRIDTIFNLGYIGQELNQPFINDTWLRYNSTEDVFFSEVLKNIQDKQVQSEIFIENISQKRVFQIPGYALIQRYGNIFMNPEKKVIFYKNTILEGFIKILNNEVSQKTISQIRKDMGELKKIDVQSYEELYDIYNVILSSLLMNTDPERFIIKKAFYDIHYNEKDTGVDSYYFYNYSLFSLYDRGQIITSELLSKNIQLFQDSMLKYEDSGVYEEYFVYFLEKLLIYELEKKSDIADFQKIITLLGGINTIAKRVYDENLEKKLTGIYVYSELLEKIELLFRENLFLAERTSENLLVLQDTTNFSVDTILKLRPYINGAVDFYERNKRFLSSQSIRDMNIAQSIENSQKLFREYFLVLEDYEQYILEYDIVNKTALGSGNTSDTYIFSQEAIEKYLSQFIGLNTDDTTFIVMENYYRIENLFISGKKFSFDLYPQNGNTLTNISIDDIEQSYEYRLDNRELDWAEKYATAVQDEKDAYDFSRFFYITFFDEDTLSSQEVFIDEGATLSEDKTEIVFKRDILLGKNGDFSSISAIVDIEYKDITLQKHESGYDVFIHNAEVSYDLEDASRVRKYSGDFSGEYVKGETVNDSYFVKFISSFYEINNTRKQYLFSGNVINFLGSIPINEFNNFIATFLNQSDQFESIYQTIVSISGIGNISIQYSYITQNMTYKFEKNGKNYTILVGQQGIEQILQGVKKLLTSPISGSELSNYIE